MSNASDEPQSQIPMSAQLLQSLLAKDRIDKDTLEYRLKLENRLTQIESSTAHHGTQLTTLQQSMDRLLAIVENPQAAERSALLNKSVGDIERWKAEHDAMRTWIITAVLGSVIALGIGMFKDKIWPPEPPVVVLQQADGTQVQVKPPPK